jgi:hypothetical protein
MKNALLNRDLIHFQNGGLHRALKVPEGEPIPAKKMEEALYSENPHIRNMANFASVLEGFHHTSHEE